MSLIKCTECGQQISSDAPTCPHCGKPRSPKKSSDIGLVQGIGLLAAGIGGIALVAYCSNQPAAAPPPPDPPRLTGTLGFGGGDFTMENTDSFDWTNCELKVNHDLFGSNGYERNIARVGAHDSIRFAASSLSTESGERFNPFTHAAKKVFIQCDTPAGRNYTGWDFDK